LYKLHVVLDQQHLSVICLHAFFTRAQCTQKQYNVQFLREAACAAAALHHFTTWAVF